VELKFDEINNVGMGMDFGEIEKIIKNIFPDHVFFKHEEDNRIDNNLEGVVVLPFNPTSENLCKWAFYKFKEKGLPVKSVKIEETPTSFAIYFE
jgi:6-pyruvoyl-tetrahydropterin synthase